MRTFPCQISIVVPLLNESENIERLYFELTSELKEMKVLYEIILVDDGSTDDSFKRISKINSVDPNFKGISLTRNFGHQAALAAGIEHASGEVIITMDADLQHPPSLISEMYSKHKEGFDIVNAIRLDTENAGFLKKQSSKIFYKLINKLSDIVIEPGAADFRLMTRKAATAFSEFREKDRFTRGLIAWMGFSHTSINYTAPERTAGKTKYTLRKMISFAISAITSFSAKPLRLAMYSGIIVSLIALVYSSYALYVYLHGMAVAGWTSTLLSILFIGGIQLITLGVFGEYLAKIFIEVKNRPLYLIEKTTDKQDD